MEQRLTFDQVASLYRAVRPEYPQALIEDVVSFAGLKPGDLILEVGCGTGQATKSFAARGFPILAIDPGPEMLRVARESLAGFKNIELIESTFEAWSADTTVVQLIIAAQSWHWVAPEVRFTKAADVLSPAGVLAVFGHVPVGLPPTLLDRFKEISLRHLGFSRPPPEAWYLPIGPFKGWFDESGLFGPVKHQCYPWQWQHTASSYIDFLRTRSDVRMLAPSVRDALLCDFAEAIEGQGGEFEVDYETHLYMARRLDRGH